MAHDSLRTADRQYHATYDVIGGDDIGVGVRTHAEYQDYIDFSASADHDAAVAACMLAATIARGVTPSPLTGRTTVTLVALISPKHEKIDVAALLKGGAGERYALSNAERPFEEAWQATFPGGKYVFGDATKDKTLLEALGFPAANRR